jgi:D-glycero-alpha-D-manno-heptose-7-phosphate kinase
LEIELIITRTPYRISFVGGGTDLKQYYSKQNGMVLSASIDKYIYVVVKRQIGIVEHKYRINYSKVEYSNVLTQIEHPIVREALILFEIDFPIEVTTFSDVPGQTGLGSSSSFAVGLVHALFALKGKMVTKHHIATIAAKIEINILKRNMGKQDHFAAAYGNLNVLTFKNDETVQVDPVLHTENTRNKLQDNLMLFYTYIKRDASEVLYSQAKVTEEKRDQLTKMKNFVWPVAEIISSGKELDNIGVIIEESWHLKKNITSKISSIEIDKFFKDAKNAGAIGGKLLGAGGGGFLLLYMKSEFQEKAIKALDHLYHMPFKFDHGGTRITYYDQPNI